MPTPHFDHRASGDPYHIPHRKNAAEWVMWVALLPLVPIVIVIERLRNRGGRRHG